MPFLPVLSPTSGPDPTLDICCGRDVFNERPATDELVAAEGEAVGPAAVLPRGVVIHTTRGDIWVKLFPDECPKTVENFTTHARNGYYDGVIFHRVIKGFMIQTGDPLGACCRRTSHLPHKGFQSLQIKGWVRAQIVSWWLVVVTCILCRLEAI